MDTNRCHINKLENIFKEIKSVYKTLAASSSLVDYTKMGLWAWLSGCNTYYWGDCIMGSIMYCIYWVGFRILHVPYWPHIAGDHPNEVTINQGFIVLHILLKEQRRFTSYVSVLDVTHSQTGRFDLEIIHTDQSFINYICWVKTWIVLTKHGSMLCTMTHGLHSAKGATFQICAGHGWV